MELLFILPALGWLFLATLLHQVLGLPFAETNTRRLRNNEPLPDSIADLLADRHEALRELGFEGPRFSCLEQVDGNEVSTRFQSAWTHPAHGVVVCLLPPENIQYPNQLNTFFISRLEVGSIFVSQAFDPFFAAGNNDVVRGQVVTGESLQDQLQAHLDWVGSQDEAVDGKLGRTRLADELLASALNQQRQELINRGLLRTGSDGISRPSLRFGLRICLAWFRRPKPPSSNAELPQERLVLMARVQHRAQSVAPARSMQWLLFAASVAAFLLLGSVIFDATFALLLAVVIAIHELGHFLAMRAFGYRQVRMMLLPLIGGVTIGHEENPDPVRRGWVSLMGPLPGIVLGTVLLWLTQSFGPDWGGLDWLGTLAWLLLVINYFNLLPVPPLDGGRIVEDLLPARWTWLRVLLVLVLCGAGIVVSLLMGLWPLVVIIALPLMTLPGFLTAARAARRVDGPALALSDRETRLRAALTALDEVAGPATNAPHRVGQAEEVLKIVRFEPVRAARQISLGGTYLMVLLAPLGSSAAMMLLWFSMLAEPQIIDEEYLEIQESVSAEVEPLGVPGLIDRFVASVDDGPLSAPPSRQAIAGAEQRLDTALPETLRHLYGRADGLASLGISPVEDLQMAAKCLDPLYDKYDEFRREYSMDLDVITFEGNDHRLERGKLSDWICIGTGDAMHRYVMAPGRVEATGPLSQRFLEFSESGIDVYPDFESWLRERVIGQEISRKQLAVRQRRQAELNAQLDDAPVASLLKRMPNPGWVERRAMGWPKIPGPARRSDVEAVEGRLQIELPEELQALYAHHDGYYPWSIVPVSELAWVSEWRDADAFPTYGPDDGSDWVLTNPGRDRKVSIGQDDLELCLVAGESMPGFRPDADIGSRARLLWCPDLEDGVVIDLFRNELYPDFKALFVRRTSTRILSGS